MHSELESLEADHETQKQPIVSTDSSTRYEEYEERRADLLRFIEKEESLRGTHEGELVEARELAKSVPQEVLQRREAKRRLIDDEK